MSATSFISTQRYAEEINSGDRFNGKIVADTWENYGGGILVTFVDGSAITVYSDYLVEVDIPTSRG